jgi:putative Mg2+ transporter-C (MgtC) family protein
MRGYVLDKGGVSMDPFAIEPITITLRLLVAGLLGGFIGWEREVSNHPAGFRTHILVCMGSTLIMLLSIYGFNDWMEHENVRMDPARLAAQVISGIGFLGAGTILRHGFTVTGLTTAASLWVVAAIGLAVGAGFYFASVVTTIFVLISLVFLNRMEMVMVRQRRLRLLKLKVRDETGILGKVSSFLGEHQVNIRKVTIEEEPEEQRMELRFTVKLTSEIDLTNLLQALSGMEGVYEVHMEQ